MINSKNRIIEKRKLNRRRYKSKKNLNSFRLLFNKTNSYLYTQLIDDKNGVTLLQASTREAEFLSLSSKKDLKAAKLLGTLISDRIKAKGINKVYFDRKGYVYHGRVKEFAESNRENGLIF